MKYPSWISIWSVSLSIDEAKLTLSFSQSRLEHPDGGFDKRRTVSQTRNGYFIRVNYHSTENVGWSRQTRITVNKHVLQDPNTSIKVQYNGNRTFSRLSTCFHTFLNSSVKINWFVHFALVINHSYMIAVFNAYAQVSQRVRIVLLPI